MIKVGTRLYYDNQTGIVFFEVPEQVHYAVRDPQSVERDIEVFAVLSERNRDTFDVLELEYGAYQQEFTEASGYRVNPETKKLEFAHETGEDGPSVFQKPLTDQIAEVKTENESLNLAIIDIYEIILG